MRGVKMIKVDGWSPDIAACINLACDVDIIAYTARRLL
jgi:hypothetical protein